MQPTASPPNLEPGRVYRTREFARWGANPPRLAGRLVARGELVPLAHGLFACPKRGRFGTVPPADAELMRAFLDGSPFVFTGPDRWNPLCLGTTAVFAMPLVYNTKRSGRFVFGKRAFELRRVAFPDPAPPEWFVVDLFEHAASAATSPEDLEPALTQRLAEGAFDRAALRLMAERYATRANAQRILRALEATS